MMNAPLSVQDTLGSHGNTNRGEHVRDTVQVSRLMLTNFRSYPHLALNLAGTHSMVVLTGANGAGKTNVLEAISYAAPGRGLRNAALDDVRRGGENDWSVALRLALKHDDLVEEVRVGTGTEQGRSTDEQGGTSKSRRIIKIDGETTHNSSLLGDRWTVNWLTPQMDRLFIEGPSARRKFLDRMAIGLYPNHSRQVGAYERVMRDRNKLLAEKGLSADSQWLSALEARMAEHGIAIAVARLEFAGQIAGQIEASPESPFPKADLALDGWLEDLLADEIAPVEVEILYRERLERERRLDTKAGRTSTGPHKTDFIVTHQPKSMRADLCSTGEQKALLVGLILANAHLQAAIKGQAPLLLMDEVAAHLDADRRKALFETLAALGSQCWLTGTDKSLFDSLLGKAEFFDVVDGTIQPSAV
jgi:DNA replication and repair protein RecF